MSTARFGRGHKAMALVPLALLSAAWTASIAGAGAPAAVSADTTPDTTLPDGSSVPTEAIEAPASVSSAGGLNGGVAPGLKGDPTGDRLPGVDLRHPGRGARRLPARRDRHQLRRQELPPLVAADRRDRQGRVRPRPGQRQLPRRQGRRPAGHLRHRARRHPRHRPDLRHRRRPVRLRLEVRPGHRPDAVHPVDLVGRRRGRRRRRQAQPAGRRRRGPRDRRLPLLRHRRPVGRRPASARPSTATTTASRTSTWCSRS